MKKKYEDYSGKLCGHKIDKIQLKNYKNRIHLVLIHLNQFGFKIHLYRGDNEAVSVKWELMTQEQLDTEKPIKNVNEKSLPPGAQSVRMATDNFTYDESELFGALSDSDEDAEGRESGVGRHKLR